MRYIDNIKENKLDFVTRRYLGCITFILCAIAFLIITTSTICTLLTNNIQMMYLVFINTVTTLFVISFPLYRIIYIINATEFQNSIFANSIKILTEFSLIIRPNMALLYKDSRFELFFNNNTIKKNLQTNWIDVFGSKNALLIKNAINTGNNLKFDFMWVSINVVNLSRPNNLYLLTATKRSLENIYYELIEKHGIAIYSSHKGNLISCNKAFEKMLINFDEDIGKIESGVSSLEGVIKNIIAHTDLQISTIDYNKNASYKTTYCLASTYYFDYNEVKNCPIPIAYLNKLGVILRLNHTFVEEFGLDIDKYINEDVSMLVNDDLSAYFATDIVRTVSIIKSSLHNGTPVKIFIKSLSNCFIAYFINYSEIKALENELIHSQKLGAVGQLAGGISHDFNNILTAIIGFCDLIMQEHAPARDLYEDIIYIKQSANKGKNLIKQILAFSSKQKLDEKVVCINSVVSSIEKFIKCLLGDEIELHIKYGEELHSSKIDVSQLEQVLINLIVNAKDAMLHKYGKIIISTANLSLEKSIKITSALVEKEIPVGDYVMIKVEDNGSGINDATLEKIFNPFFSTKEVGKGTGLGLSSVYGIVTQMKGYIYVESKLDIYSRFTILLPRTLERFAIEHTLQEKIQPAIKSDKFILLIEDEELIRNFLTRALKKKGYNVIVVGTPEEVTDEFLKSNRNIDLVISDVVMPCISGPEIVAKIVQKISNIKVIFISGYSQDKICNLNYSFEFIAKPFDLNNLISKIEAIFLN